MAPSLALDTTWQLGIFLALQDLGIKHGEGWEQPIKDIDPKFVRFCIHNTKSNNERELICFLPIDSYQSEIKMTYYGKNSVIKEQTIQVPIGESSDISIIQKTVLPYFKEYCENWDKN